MIALQVGIIVFLSLVLAVVCYDDYRKRIIARKTAHLNRFWNEHQDRRKSVRLDTQLDVLYETIPNHLSLKRNSVSKNISLGGINLALNEKLQTGTMIKMQFGLPDARRLIAVQGEVVWVKEIAQRFTREKQERFFSTGIKFTQIKREDGAALSSFINQRTKNGEGG
ncbi:MAG: PilZ domain-containing protein [Candidatus Omnitrophica bacterium]|nr:PilZ domain-containing protein [Candidatus Omnitrophota bacterium]